MGKINTAHVVLGGLLAGLVINISEFLLNEPILGAQWVTAMEALNKTPIGGGAIGITIVWGLFEVCIATVAGA